MPSLADAELPPPKSWDAFEELCADLFQREWKFPHTARYGRQGQRQNGVDIYGRPGGSGHSGVQCKGKRRWPPSKITKTEIDREVAKALKFRPKLEELIFATTAENDTVIQDHVNSITERHEKTGLFRVYVYWWGEIARRITLYDDLTRKHFQFARIASDVLVSEVRAMLLPVGLIDQEISKQLEQITRSRFFGSVDSSEIAERFSARILTGDLQGGSPSKRADALAWCARLLAFEHTSRAEDMLNQAKLLGSSDALCLISNAFIAAASGDNNGALFILSALQTSAARTAAFIVANKGDSFEECTRWLAQVGFSVDDLDADGKFQFISRCLAGQQWDKAIEVIGSLTDQDYHQTPTLLYTAGISHLIQATPEEFRPLLVRQLPFELSTFPLGSTEIMRAHRDFAREFFGKCSKAAEELSLLDEANIAADFELWLRLRDPDRVSEALSDLRGSMSDPRHSLRRLNFAVRFGLTVNVEEVEREINRQTALTGGKSADAAFGRFVLAFSQSSESDVAAYIAKHKSQLIQHLDPTSVSRVEVEMLSLADLGQEFLAHRLDQPGIAIDRAVKPQRFEQRDSHPLADPAVVIVEKGL